MPAISCALILRRPRRSARIISDAGVSILQPLADTSDESYEEAFDVNVRGTLNGLRSAATDLADNGRIINLSTTALAPASPR